jgi:Zn-dependent alcohol dehydrogenase
MAFKIPEGIGLEEASVIGCRVTTAYNAVKHVGALAPGDSALVIGCGGIGLNTIQFLKCFGAHPIIAVDVIDKKLDEAKKFGATHTINAENEDPVADKKADERRRRQSIRGHWRSQNFGSNHSGDSAGRNRNDHRRPWRWPVHDQ